MRASLSILTVLAALLAPLTLHAPTAHAATATPAANAADGSTGMTARVVVRFKPDSPLLRAQPSALTPSAAHAERARALGTRLGRAMRAGRALNERTQVVFADGVTSAQLAAELASQGDVELAVVDQRRQRMALPNDPLYASGNPVTGPAAGQWYLKPPSTTGQPSSIDAESAWDVTVGSPSIVVAVLDTGVRYDHPDLAANLLPGYDMVSDAATANDGGGRDSDASDPGDFITAAELNTAGGPFYGGAPTNCSSSSGPPYPAEASSWHGTQTAGLVGAVTNNGVGMASVGRTVKVLPVRVLGKCGGFDSDIAAAIQWAAGADVPGVPTNPNPARVINLSLGGAGACNAGSAQVYLDAVAAANARGAVVVASAGNSTGHAVSVPANCPGVIAVGGLRNVGTKVGFSDLGPEVAISAPGGNCVSTSGACQFPILTTSNAGAQGPGASIYTDAGGNASVGTSFSAPLVAGTAALMLSVKPSLTPAEVKSMLQSTSRAFPQVAGVPQCVTPQAGATHDQLECNCTSSTCGAGMLDAGKAVLAAAGVQARIDVSPATPQPAQAVTLNGSGSAVATGRTIAGYQWALVDGGGIVSGFDGSPNAASVTLTPTAAGTFTVQLTVTDSQGSSSSVTNVVSVQQAGGGASSGGGGGHGGGALGLPWLLLLAAAIPAVAATRRRQR